MMPENKERIKLAVKDAGDFLNGKLPDVPGLSKRNSYAHLWRCIKEEMGRSYKDCDDNEVEQILNIVEKHKNEDCVK